MLITINCAISMVIKILHNNSHPLQACLNNANQLILAEFYTSVTWAISFLQNLQRQAIKSLH